VGATRSVMDYLIEGARLDPDMSGSMGGGCDKLVTVTGD
jgi:hypothetical protein